MFFKKEKEFQYHPAVIKMLEDVVGGGTIVRADLRTAIFDGMPLDELPPYCVVGKDENGGYRVIKTALVTEALEAEGTTVKVNKSHLFAVGDFVIDKSNAGYDVITLEAKIGAAKVGQVLVGVKEKSTAGKATLVASSSELVITLSKVDLTVANQSCGLMVRGTISEGNMPFPIDAGLKALMSLIRFVNKKS